jgi:hypothetical protein
MMVEYRATLLVDKEFEGGFKLDRGTIIYAQENEDGWLGMYYEDKGAGHGFALKPEEFSIHHRGDTGIAYLVALPPPPADVAAEQEAERQRRELAERRTRARIRTYREEADRLERMLGGQTHDRR